MHTIRKMRSAVGRDAFWKNLFRNSFWAFVGESSASIIGLVVTVALIKIIGSDSYGVLILAQSYMLIMDTIVNVQSWKSVIQYGQRCIVEKNIERLNSFIKLGSILDISTAVLCMVIALLLAEPIGSLFGWSNELIFCSQLFSITIISHFSGTPIAILRLYNKFHLVALQKMIGALVKLAAILVLYFAMGSMDLRMAAIVYCVSEVINNILLIIFAIAVYRKHSCLKNIFCAKLPEKGSGFIGFTIWGTISEAVDIPVNNLDVFLVSTLGTATVSIYKVFKQCVGILYKVSSPIQQSIMPQFSELNARKDSKRGFEIVLKIHRAMMTIVMPIAIVVGLLSPVWLKIIYGDMYANEWHILILYLIVQTYALSYSTIHPYFLSLNQPKKSAIYVFVSNTIYFILAFILVDQIGLMGMVLAFAVQCTLVIWLKIIDIKRIVEGVK